MSLEQVKKALESVVAIAVTPFDDRGSVDLDCYTSIVDRCVSAGVEVVTANGNTGEFYALRADEQAGAVAATVAGAGGRATVLAGVGYSAAQAAADAVTAGRAGAHGVMVHQPVHPYQSTDGWIAYHREVADAVPELGVVCYVRSPSVTADAFRRLADACPNVVGVKYAVPDPVALADLIAAVGPQRLAWSCGLAETWAPFFRLAGAGGFTSGLATVVPEQSLLLLAHLRAGDVAAASQVWRRLRPFEDMRARNASALNVSVVKEALSQQGLCRPDVRPPIVALTKSEQDEVRTILAAFDEAAT